MGAMLSSLFVIVFFAGLVVAAEVGSGEGGGSGGESGENPVKKELPEPDRDGTFALEKALDERRSRRSFSGEPLSLSQAGQLLWAAQGISDERRGYRTAPSAGATFPLDVYLVAGDVDELAPAIYKYEPSEHAVTPVVPGDQRSDLRTAALGQDSVGAAPAAIVITGTYARTTQRYGERGEMYTHMEAGHAGQNIYLQATALGLGTVAIGAFVDDSVSSLLRLSGDEKPLYIYPVGHQ